MNDTGYQLMFEGGTYSDPEKKKGLLCSITWSEPYHSEFSYFHGIRLREPHTGSLGHAQVYTDPVLAMQVYLKIRWQGFRPALSIHAGLDTVMHWETKEQILSENSGLPF